MSSQPSPSGAAKAIELIDRAASLDHEIKQLRPMAVRLKKAEEERSIVGREIGEHLRSMDCDSPGNFGWEGRFGWLLAEVLRQVRSAR